MSETKQHILQVAIERMQQVGIRSVSVDDVCHELGMSKKTFYVYFPSKDDLIQAILHTHEQKVAHDLDNALSKRTITQVIVEWSKIAKSTTKKDLKTPAMMYDLEKYYPQLFAAHKKVMRETAEKILVRFLGKGVSEGIFREEIDVDVVAMMFLDMQYRLLDLMTSGQMTKEEVHRIGHQRMDILMRGILTESGLLRLREKVKYNI
ncbi:MAG: TetR/AcrR family transcriptional regulator [Paludibacteraceae bacterium]|nr:TetR/AcrR family transcriptional regulator [Paludibacteraceae bacterium]